MALYGYSYKLPKLSEDQKKQLVDLAIRTARKASVVDKGRFRKGWRARTVGNTLIVDTRVPHAVFVERGLGYNRHNRYKVRDALNSIGFERYFQKEIGSLTVPAAAITATAVATASGSDTEDTQEAPSSQNTTQTPKPNTLITSDELIGLNALEIKNLIVQRTSIANITANPQLQKPIETGNYFDVDSLLLLIAAAVAANELTKEEDNGKTVTKKNEELREITSAVLVPGVCDWHEETYTEEEVLKAERNFSKYCKKANLQHEHQLDESMAEFTESYILPNDMIHEGRVIKKGTWLATMKVKSDALWDAVKEGTFKGFSIGCKVKVEQIVAKARGNYEGDLDMKATKRLSDFNFKDDFCHVALVTEGANGSDILVMKAKEQEHKQTPKEPKTKGSHESVNKQKDVNMTQEEIDAMKARELKLQEEVEAMKAKQEADAKLAEEIETLKAKETEMAEELEAFKAKEVEAKKAKEEAEKEAFVAKAKEMVGICEEDKAEEFGADMFLIKSLAPEAFDRVMEKLEKAEERMKKLDVVSNSPGSTEGGAADLEGEELIEFKAKALKAEDESLSDAAARIQVRKAMRLEAIRAQD